jgi:hypothetical protein
MEELQTVAYERKLEDMTVIFYPGQYGPNLVTKWERTERPLAELRGSSRPVATDGQYYYLGVYGFHSDQLDRGG